MLANPLVMPSAELNLQPINWERATVEVLYERILDSEVIGMGGAGFPTAEKIAIARKHPPNVVIANGMETDPGVCSDQVLLEQHLQDVLEGLRIVAKVLDAEHCYIALSTEETVRSAQTILGDKETVRYLKPTFQNGAERELIQILTGHVVKDCSFPAHEGYVVLNVHTLFAVARAVSGTPLTGRLVTIDQDTRWINFGTPVANVLESDEPIRVGCYATGRRPQENEVLTAEINALSIDKSVHALACIHCGWCDKACPRHLPVESLYLIAQQQEPNSSVQDLLDRCNDCGACVVACPSNIHLLDHIRALRQSNRYEQERILRAERARTRVEARERRLHAQAIKADNTRTERLQQEHRWK